MSRDRQAGTDIDSYSDGDPINLIDPTGRGTICVGPTGAENLPQYNCGYVPTADEGYPGDTGGTPSNPEVVSTELCKRDSHYDYLAN